MEQQGGDKWLGLDHKTGVTEFFVRGWGDIERILDTEGWGGDLIKLCGGAVSAPARQIIEKQGLTLALKRSVQIEHVVRSIKDDGMAEAKVRWRRMTRPTNRMRDGAIADGESLV